MARQGSYQRPDGRWQVRETFPNGERRSFYGKTEREAIAKKNRALEDYRAGISRAGESLTVNALMQQWLDDVAADNVRPSTLTAYTSHFTAHIKPAMKNIRLRDLEASDVDRMLRKIVQSGTSPTTANRVRATLRAALNYAMDQRWINFNAAASARARKEAPKRVQPLTIEQARMLIAETRDTPIGNLIEVAIYTGLRQGELLALEWKHIDFDAETLSVEQTLTWIKNPDGDTPRSVPQFADPKTESSERTIHIPIPAIEALKLQKTHVEELQALATVSRWKPLPGRDLVFPSSVGGPMNSSNVTNRLKTILKDLKMPHERAFHSLRHLTASLLLAEGADLFAVKEYLGHSQITLTADTYGHLTKKLSETTAARLSGALLDANKGKSAPKITPDTISPDDTSEQGEG